MNKTKEQKYITTPQQIADTVAYCLQMTVQGNRGKDWLPNVLEALDIVKTRTIVSKDKIILQAFTPNVDVVDAFNFGTPKRQELEKLLEQWRRNPSNGNRHVQAIIDCFTNCFKLYLRGQSGGDIENIVRGYLKFVVVCEENNIHIPDEYNEVTGELDGYAKTYVNKIRMDMFQPKDEEKESE